MSRLQIQAAQSCFLASPETANQIIQNGLLHLNRYAPFFHRPSRDINTLPVELCTALLVIGLLISEDTDAHDIGCIMLTSLRESILKVTSQIAFWR
jgi:hypothetical protein